MSWCARGRFGLLVVTLLLGPRPAAAQLVRLFEPFNLQTFHPRPAAECSLAVGCAETAPAGALRLATAVTFSSRPLVLMKDGSVEGGGLTDRDTAAMLVKGQAALELLAAWTPIEGLELHAEMPVMVFPYAESQAGWGMPLPAAWGTGTPSLGARWTALSQRRDAPFALALALDLLPPVGWKEALAGNSGWMAAPRLELAFWGDQAVVAMEIGAELRREAVRVGDQLLRHRAVGGVVVAGRSAPLRAEASLRVISTGHSRDTALEVLIGIRYAKARSASEFYVAVGPGLRSAIGYGDIRVLVGVAWGRGLAPVAPPPPPLQPVEILPN